MELVSLDVERFGCIGRAFIRFRSGLNVLHGANEVGKSSIAQAIRFALLLPSSSSAADRWIPWSGGEPTVTLVFRSGTDYYRVKKVFGTNTASLERSPDGSTWAAPPLARARHVEAPLRALLQWGIPEPGGPKAPKGIPESFLANALLADQQDVSSILEQGLEGDAVDSGRARVRAALQALAQDPLFKSVLDVAQDRVDKAFTSSGQRKRGANDPFKKMADDLAARRQERDEAEEAAFEGQRLAQRLTGLQRDTVLAEGELQEKCLQRQALEQRRVRQRALVQAVAARNAGKALIDAVTEADGKVKAAEAVLCELEPRMPELRRAEGEARRTFDAATADASAVREKRKGELAQEEAALLREREALRTRRARVDIALDLRKADSHREQGDLIEQKLETLDREITVLERVETWSDLVATKASLESANEREAKASELLARAADLRRRVVIEWPTTSSNLLPDAKNLIELRNLHHKLDKAEAMLDVGLSVEMRGATSVVVSIDGSPKEAKALPVVVEARSSAELELGGGIEVAVRGGKISHRQEAERLRKEWRDTTGPLFATLSVADFPALEDACRLDAQRKATADALAREAEKADAERTALGDPAAEKQRLSARLAELVPHLQGADISLIEAATSEHGSQIGAVLRKKSDERELQRAALTTQRARESALRERLFAEACDAAIADLDGEVVALERAALELDERERKVSDERQLVDTPFSNDASLEEAVTRTKAAVDDASAKIASATSERDIWTARLQERRATAAGVDIVVLTQAEEAARTVTREDGADVDDAMIASARSAEEAAKRHHDSLLGELRKAEGALYASGGAVADERLRELENALRRAHEQQINLEDEYEAWKLLADTLKEAERSQAAHLGNVLAPDLAARLQALTGPRYSGIALSPHLGLEGIEAANGRRELERLSLGTREQLSTLFRLCLAERLQSTLLLDDQLVQSDPDRLRWFRRTLRQTAATGVQVVVLTCRPDDYLEPAETPPPHVVDLRAVVTA